MAKKMKRLLSLIICVMMIVSSFAFTSVAGASQFADMPNNWSTAALTHAVNNGLLRGKTDSLICPNDYLTRAEMATVINRAFNSKVSADISSYTDVSSSDWYHNEFEKSLNMQTFYGTGDNMFRPENAITREEVFIAIARALVVSTDDYSALDRFTDGSDVSSWAKEYVSALVSNGYVNGYGNGLILPKNNITRAEFAQLLYNIFKQYISTPGTYSEVVDEGGVVVRNEGISLSDITVNGDLVIADGVGDGILTLKNVKVNGRLLVRGSKQITVTDCEFTKGIVVKNVNGIVHFDNYRNEAPFKNLTEVTKATFKEDSYSIDFGGSSGGSGSSGTTVVKYRITLVLDGGHLPQDANNVIKWKEGTTITSSDLPPVAIKPGFVFGGWYTDDTFTTPFTSQAVTGAFDIYAKWMAKVSYDSMGGSSVDYEIVELGATATEPAAPTYTGKIFGGWYTDEECTTAFNFATAITQNITLYAKWTDTPAITYTVTFDSKGGSAVSSMTVNENDLITEPAAPTKEGHNFGGWFKDEAYTTEFDFATEQITGNITLYAKWNIKKFTVTFDMQGAPNHTITDVEYNSTIPAPVFSTDKEGYVFRGWFKAAGGLGGVFNFNHDKITEDTIIYGDWYRQYFYIHFMSLGGNIHGNENVNLVAYYGEPLANLPDNPVKDNAVFGGWYKDTGYETPYNHTTELIYSEFPVYAKWTYTVDFDSNGGSDVASQNVVHGKFAEEPQEPSKAGEFFEGWFADAACTVAFNFATPVTESITLYAKWSPIPVTMYTVTFDSDGGSAVASQTVSSGSKITKPADPTKTGFTFNGWLKPDNSVFDFENDTITGDITLKADWTAKEYTVTFDSMGGSDVSSQTVEHGHKATRPSDPTKTGYTFDNWYKEDNTIFDFNTEITEDITLKAGWTINTYSVTFDADGGSPVPAVQNVDYGGYVTLPAEPSKEGYNFNGWYTDDACTVEYNFAAPVTEALNLKAGWTAKRFTITFVTGSGFPSVPPINNIEYNTLAAQPADPSMTGYDFKGWYTSDSYVHKFDFATETVKSNLTLYAKWDIKYHTVTFDTDGGDAVTDQTIAHGNKATRPFPDPRKTGHTFLGWFKSDLTTTFNFNDAITADTTVYAGWKKDVYKVHFESNGGTPVLSQDVEYEDYVTEPAVPTRDGYTFGGWYKEDTFTTEFDFYSDVITEETTLYAKWDLIPVEYVIVSFVTNCANTIDDREIVKGTKISQPTVENQGYTLEGWYTTEDFKPETKIDFGTYTFDASITIYANWTANPVYYTVKFYDGMSDEYLEGEESYISGSLIPETDIPSTTKYKYDGFYKDSSISLLYDGNEYQHYIDPLWFYLGDDGKWKLFDIENDIVESDLELHYGAKWLEAAAYVNQLSHEFQVKTPYEVDPTDAYLTNVFKDMLFRNRNNLNNAYNLPQLDEKKAKLMSKLTKAGFIDEDKNILIQNIKLKFSRLIGDENLREFIVENAKKQLSSNDGLKDTLTNYIDSHSAYDIERLIIKAIDKQLNNPAERQETIEMIEELVLDVIENNPSMFADMIEDYIETEIAEGHADTVETLVGEIITDGMTADDLKEVAKKVNMTPYINEYIDSLTLEQLKSYYDRIVAQFINNPNFVTYIKEYVDIVDDETLTAFMNGYINQSGEGKVFKDYLTDMEDDTLASYIADNLKDVMDDSDINAYISEYIDGLSEAKFKEYAQLYIDSLDADTKKAYIKSYLDTLSENELTTKVAEYVLGLSDVSGELKNYIGKISNDDLVEYISEYIKDNPSNEDIITYIIDYVKGEIQSAAPNATVMNKVTEFITDNASTTEEVKKVMKDVLPDYAKTINKATITLRITDYFNTTEGETDFYAILRKYLESEGFSTSEIDAILLNSAEIANHKDEAIEYVVEEIRKDNSEVFKKDALTGEFTNEWVNVDKVVNSFISNNAFVSEMLTVDGVMGDILEDSTVINTITSKATFRTQIMNMILDNANVAVMNSAIENVISTQSKKEDVINKVITSLLAGDDASDKAEVEALVSKIISKDETVEDLADYLKNNLSTNEYALTGAVNYIYQKRSTEITKIVNHIKDPNVDTSVIIGKISSAIVDDDTERAEIIDLIVTFITKAENADKKNEIIDDAIAKLVADSDELANYITSIFNDADTTKKDKFLGAIKTVIFADAATAKADIKEFVNVIISSSNTFGKETLINTYIDDIWGVEADKAEFINRIAEEFVTNSTVRSQVMSDAIDAINKTQSLKDKLVEKLLEFIEESDDHLESIVIKVVEKMVGTSTTPADETLKEKMINFIVDYLKAHPDDLDEIVDEVLKDDPNVDGELGDILNEFVRQLIEEDKFVINEDNKFIAEGMQLKLTEMSDYTDLFEMVPGKVETLYKKIEKFLPVDIIQDIYTRTINDYLTQLEAGINSVSNTTTGEAETFITLIVNPVTELLNPLYERAINKAEMKLNGHFFYDENEYLQEVVDILTPSAMLDGNDSLATDVLSGYKLREFDEYYFLLMRLSVLTDDTAQWYMDNIGQEKTEQVMDSLQSRFVKVMSYYNKALAMVDEYTKSGDLPDRLDNQYVDKLIDILDSRFPYFDKLLNKFDGSKLDRPIKESDYDRLYQVVDILFRNRTFIADDLFDSSYADKLDRFRTDDDTYKVSSDRVGTARLERNYE